MATGFEDAWEDATLMLGGLESLAMPREEQWFGRHVGHWLALKTCFHKERHKCWRKWCSPTNIHNIYEYMGKDMKGFQRYRQWCEMPPVHWHLRDGEGLE